MQKDLELAPFGTDHVFGTRIKFHISPKQLVWNVWNFLDRLAEKIIKEGVHRIPTPNIE